MDYDDNEFQGQNLQLAGEGSTKFPPDLRPYALPKFDFDDSLHGHLRFDSLVETEVFLGIESNVDNQWIDDFSRGSSGIEFRTSAAESCSISRHNNVWSEAASSESVEMLLKSVGQEDNIPGKPIIRELDACDELGCLIRQMDSSSNLDDSSLSTSKDVINIRSTLPSNEILSSFSGLKEDASESQEKHTVDVSSQKIEGESSGSGNLIDQIPAGVSGMSRLSYTEGITIADQKQANTIIESSDTGMLRDSPGLVKHVDNSSTCPHNTSTSTVELNTLEVLNGKSEDIYKNADDFRSESGVHGMGYQCMLEDKTNEHGMEYQSVQEAETNKHGMEYQSVQEGETNEHGMEYPYVKEDRTNGQDLEEKVVERNDIIFSTANAVELSHKMSKGDSELLTVEEAQKPENQVLLEDVGIIDPLKVSVLKSPGMVTKPDNIIETPMEEVNNVNNIEASSLSMEDKIGKAEVDQSSFNRGRDTSIVEAECSTMRRETQTAVTSRGDEGCSVVSGDANSNVSSSNLYGPMEILEEVKNFEQTDGLKSDESLPKIVKEKIELPFTCTSNDCEVAESCMDKPESTPLGNVIPSNELSPKTISNSGHELERVHLQSANVGSTGQEVQKKDACHDEMPSDPQGLLKEAIHDQKNGMEDCSHVPEHKTVDGDGVVILAISDKQEEIAREENIDKLSVAVSAASEPKKNETSVQILSSSLDGIRSGGVGPIDQEDSKTPSVSGDEKLEQIAVSKTDGLPPGSNVEVQKDIIDSTQSESDPKIHALDSGSCCIDPDEPTCGSPTIIRATEESPGEKEKTEIKGAINPNVSAVEAIEAINTDASKLSFVSSDAKENDASKGEKNFTFEVSSTEELPTTEAGKNWQPFTPTQASKPSPNVEGSPLISTIGQLNSKVVQDVSKGNPQVSNKESGRSGAKGTSERKSRRPSSKATGKESAKRGNNTKGTTSARQIEKRDKTCNASLSPGISQRVQSSEMPHYGLVDGSSVKQFGILGTPTSTLPDLNTSSSSVFQQPFTDLQQVQLRAQIFVYGALIQGAAPDETYMSSAFGGPDGGKSIWEAAWRACIERLHGQKSILNNTETPLQSRSGIRADSSIKHGSTQGKVVSSPLGRTSCKSTPPPIVNSMIPLSSPLWSVPAPSGDAMQSVMPRGPGMDYSQTVSPLHPQQIPVRNFVGHNTWISQSPFRATWVASPPATAIDTSSRFPVLPFSETAQLTTMKEPSLPLSSGVKSVSSGPLVQSASGVSVFPGTSPILDSRKVTGPSSQHSDAKPRKRKKTPVSEDSSKILLPQSQTETVLAPVSITHMPVPAPIGVPHVTASVSSSSTAGLISKVSSERAVPVLPTNSNDQLLKIDRESRQKVTLSDETFTELKKARAHAEDASASAATAVSHSQEVWNQLDRQKNSGFVPDVESKLAYAAVVVAAASAVARAAAAAANVASNAALQAKLMADDAFKSSSCSENNEMLFGLEKATPASILKGENLKSGPSSIILAAREAARRNVEAASAASKKAENMDAIVKAAELAAEAVSQAGKIVGMDDPLSLNDLLEAGMNGYWRPSQEPARMVANAGDSNIRRLDNLREGPETSTVQSMEAPSDKRETHTANQGTLATGELLGDSIDDRTRLIEGIPSSLVSSIKSTKGQRGVKASDLAKTIGVVPESDIGSKSSSISIQIEQGKEVEPLKVDSIKEGSYVEVFKEEFKAAWFMAKVLSLKDENAYVCYTELNSDEGSEKIKEWVSLKTEGDKAPKIRIARPLAAFPSEGTRKRRRGAISEYTWSVGDRVEAWMQDSWWEGVVTEKNKKDETTYTVHFEARGEIATVRVWHLRPSLVWKDGEWVESCSSIGRASNEVDARQEKRLKLGSTVADAKGKDKISKVSGAVEAEKSDEPRLLDLCMNEKVFNIGKSTVSETKPQTLRMMRTGLQKEGSRVVFGVPKPGKKRKFMDVSKHYVDQGSKVSESSNDSMKFTKYLMPQGQGSGPRGWKTASKSEPKEKRAGFAKSKIPKSGKPPSVSNRTIMQKENSPAVSASDDVAGVDHSEKKDLAGNVDDTSEKHDDIELQSLSSSDGAAGNSMVFSSMHLSSEAPSKKVSSSNTRTERITKGKLAPAGGRLAKINEDKVSNDISTKSTSDVVEPRRSNRRIQPTSRLLEGLQSSLIISKIPSGSHDRGHKNQNRSTSRGNNHG